MRPLDITLVVLEVVLAVGAYAGGGMLLIDPTGASMGMTVEVLQRTPFETFMVPAIILLLVNGVFPTIVAVAAIMRHPLDRHGHLAVGMVLVGWMVGQGITIGFSQAIQAVCLALGLIILGLAIMNLRR